MKSLQTLAHLVAALLLIAVLTSCMAKKSAPPAQAIHLDSIALLPVDTRGVNSDGKEGGPLLDDIIRGYFAEKDIKGIRTVSREQLETMRTKLNQPLLEEAISMGRELQVQGILVTSLSRFRQRGGSKYSVSSPASVAFEYRLLAVANGETLCTGSFDETQQSISENILSLGKIWKRGMKWITAEELAKEGVDDSFQDCGYLIP